MAHLRVVLVGLVLFAAGAYSWGASGLAPSTLGIGVATGIPATLFLGVAAYCRPARPVSRHRSPTRSVGTGQASADGRRWSVAGAGTWVALVAAAVVWNLVAAAGVLGTPHPTLSSMAAVAMEHRPVRALAFLAWLSCGWQLVRR